MRFKEIFQRYNRVLSLEFYPPRKVENIGDTLDLIAELKTKSPHFMTCTYGAGGGTRSLSREIVTYIQNVLDVQAAQHLTCVGHSKDDIDQILQELEDVGVQRVLALRGDPPKGESSFETHPDGFANARDLTAYIRRNTDFSIAVAGYPETHREAISPDADITYLKEKVDAGAEVVITQVFFEPKLYFDYVERLEANGVRIPVLPGIMPVANANQLKRFIELCGASIPTELSSRLHALGDNAAAVTQFGVDYAVRQCEALLRGGAPGIHLYTLNRTRQCVEIIDALNLGMIQQYQYN